MICFVQDCELEVVENYDEEADLIASAQEGFRIGDEVDAEIINTRDGGAVDLQCGDGSVILGVDRDLFVTFQKIDDGSRLYEDYTVEGLIVRGTNKFALVVSQGLLSNFEIHTEEGTNTSDNNAFLKCIRWVQQFTRKDQ